MATLSIVVCGAPLASAAMSLLQGAVTRGWDASLAATEAAHGWLDDATLAQLEGPPRRPDAIAVCPLTFNTGNKWAAGISDTSVLGLLNEALGTGSRVIAVPFVNETLWRHPAWSVTLDRLAGVGVSLLDPATGVPSPQPVAHGSGSTLAAAFDPEWVLRLLD